MAMRLGSIIVEHARHPRRYHTRLLVVLLAVILALLAVVVAQVRGAAAVRVMEERGRRLDATLADQRRQLAEIRAEWYAAQNDVETLFNTAISIRTALAERGQPRPLLPAGVALALAGGVR